MKLLGDIREVLRAVRRRRPSKMYCPRCGAAGIRLSSSLDYWLMPVKYVCESCGYNGPVVMELEKED